MCSIGMTAGMLQGKLTRQHAGDKPKSVKTTRLVSKGKGKLYWQP